eukprot:Rmarinus@m.28454
MTELLDQSEAVLVPTAKALSEELRKTSSPKTLRLTATHYPMIGGLKLAGKAAFHIVSDVEGVVPIIDLEGSGRFLMIPSSAVLYLSGIEIRNGNYLGNGGALYNQGKLIMESCLLSNNAAVHDTESGIEHSFGGAVYNAPRANFVAESCCFDSNSAFKGGAVYSNSGNLSLRQCQFTWNVSNAGSAVYSRGPFQSVDNVVVDATGHGVLDITKAICD